MLTKSLSNVTLKKSQENITGKIGLSWIAHCMKHFGLEATSNKIFPNLKSNRARSAWDKILTGSLMFISGGERIEDIENLRADKALVNSLGWKSMISPDTFINFIKKKGNQNRLKKIMDDIAVRAMKQSELDEFVYDSDATYFDSQKDCATYSYQESKQMSAMLGFLPELNGLCVTADYRPGNESPASGILEQLQHINKLAKRAKKKLISFRHDSAAHNMEIFQFCEKNKINYFVTLCKDKVVMQTATGILESRWNPLKDNKETEWAEATHCIMKNKKNTICMRILILRWPNPDPQLFDITPFCYHVIATNNWDITPMEWLDFHNGRMNSENYNKEIKSGFSCSYTPSHNFINNSNYFLIGIIAYNMIQLMKLFYLNEYSSKWTIKTMRYWFVNTCGKFVRSRRKITCKIINCTNQTFTLFTACLSKLVLSPV
jgi:hypothetical protein